MEQAKYDVFISYSSKDQKVAEGICGYLECNGFRCFVAYRDIPKGVIWARVIPQAISCSKIMVVVFSEAFNVSEQTDRELDLASKHKLPILTFRITDSDYTGAKEFFLWNINWIDAFPNPDEFFGQLCDSVSKLLNKNVSLHANSISVTNGQTNYNQIYKGNKSDITTSSKILYRKKGTNNLYGYIDVKGNFIIPPIYKDTIVRIFNKEYYTFAQNEVGKWGIIDRQGRIVQPFEYDDIYDYGIRSRYICHKNNEMFGVCKDGKWGLQQMNGKIIFPCNYERYSEYSPVGIIHKKGVQLFIIKQNGKVGAVDKDGMLQIPCVWEDISNVLFGNDLLKVRDFNDNYGLLDLQGRVVALPQWKSFYQSQSENELSLIQDNKEQWGCMDNDGHIVIPCEYDAFDYFSDGVAIVEKKKQNFIIDTKNQQIPLGDRRFLLEVRTDRWVLVMGFRFFSGLLVVCQWHEQPKMYFSYGCINKKGELVIPCIWKQIIPSTNGIFWVIDDQDRLGIMDKNGTLTFPCSYLPYRYGEHNFIAYMEHQSDFFCVTDGYGKQGFINNKGELIIPFGEWEFNEFSILLFDRETSGREVLSTQPLLLIKDKKGKLAVFTLEGKCITLGIWDGGFRTEGLILVMDNNKKWGCIDCSGRLVIPPRFNDGFVFENGRAIVEDDDGTSRYIDKNGNYIDD